MTLTTIIKRLEEEQERLDKNISYNKLSNDYMHVVRRLNGALLLLYRIRDGVPLTLDHEIPERKN